jgi:hypothetical protein
VNVEKLRWGVAEGWVCGQTKMGVRGDALEMERGGERMERWGRHAER